jgi:hypothetical protein
VKCCCEHVGDAGAHNAFYRSASAARASRTAGSSSDVTSSVRTTKRLRTLAPKVTFGVVGS